MDTKELKAVKQEMEKDILQYVTARIKGFEESTGVYVNFLDFDVVDTTAMGGRSSMELTGVHIGLDL
jgi:hypothetical protein